MVEINEKERKKEKGMKKKMKTTSEASGTTLNTPIFES